MRQRLLTEEELEVYEECRQNDPVHRDIRYVYFVSRSKGRGRNGKRRVRREPAEIRLLSYRGRPFVSWHLFPFDTRATECLGQSVSPEDAEAELIRRIEGLRRRGRTT